MMLKIGSRRECFFDDWLIDTRKTSAQFLLHSPVRRETVMTMDKPWEGDGSTMECLVKDGALYRLYYIGRRMETEKTDLPDRYVHCMAESRDGLHWERPCLGMYDFRGSTDNNILSGRTSRMHGGMYVFIDTNPACPPEERWRAIACAIGKDELFSVPSPDGIHFDYSKRTVIHSGGFYDSMHACFWDESIQKYRCYFRGHHFPAGYDGQLTDCHDRRAHSLRIRDINYVESPDFVHWSEGRIIGHGDAEDVQLYENKIVPYYRAPHMYIGFPTRYLCRKTWTENYDELTGREARRDRCAMEPRFGLAVTDCTFMCSRDGVRFHRYDEAFLRPGPENSRNWVYGDGYPAYGIFETPSPVPGAEPEISLLVPENQWSQNIDLVRYSIRRDGFVSLHAGGRREETVVTKPFTFTGEELYANISTSALGYLYFTLTAWDGSCATSCEVFGDATDRRIPFPPGAVAALSGRTVTMQVRMRDADLYAIRFAPSL